MKQRNDNDASRDRESDSRSRRHRVEQLEGVGRREFLFRDRLGKPADEEEATHVEVIEYDAQGRFVLSTIAERTPERDPGR